MFRSRARLRISIQEREERKTHNQPGGYTYGKKINDKHSLSFFFIGMSLNLNLDTSLLTEKIFNVENFANVTLFLYFGVVIIATILYMFLIPAEFWQLVLALWVLVASRICHFVLSLFAHGKSGRNWFLVFYTLNGFLRGVISLTGEPIFLIFLGTFVISKYFLNESYLHLLNGGVFFSIVVSLLQVFCDILIGTGTVAQFRKSLVISQGLYLFETIIGAIWMTIIYIAHRDDNFNSTPNGNGKNGTDHKYDKAIKKFSYISYYSSKLLIVILASFFRVVFHPVLLPYMMDIDYGYKLVASISFTVFEFFGRLTTFSIDEYIDVEKRPKDSSHFAYLIKQDTHLYLLFIYQCIACTFSAYSSWYQKYGISKSAIFVTFVTMTSGFISGYTDNRGVEGSKAAVEYYSRVKNAKGLDHSNIIITNEIANDTSNVNDILTLADYSSYLIGCVLSYYVQYLITKHKETVEFIIMAHRGYFDEKVTNLVYSKIFL